MGSTTDKLIKYAGVDWLSKHKPNLSPLAIKVADVLGQVEAGIYHMETLHRSKTPDWANNEKISVISDFEFATFDDSRLTRLVLCSAAADLKVEINGSFGSSLKLTFEREPNCFEQITDAIVRARTGNFNNIILTTTKDLTRIFTQLDQIVDEYENSERYQLQTIHRTKGLGKMDMERLINLLVYGHETMTRISVSGNNNHSVRMMFSQRASREGSIFDRHPTLESHMDILGYLWRPLLSTTGD